MAPVDEIARRAAHAAIRVAEGVPLPVVPTRPFAALQTQDRFESGRRPVFLAVCALTAIAAVAALIVVAPWKSTTHRIGPGPTVPDSTTPVSTVPVSSSLPESTVPATAPVAVGLDVSYLSPPPVLVIGEPFVQLDPDLTGRVLVGEHSLLIDNGSLLVVVDRTTLARRDLDISAALADRGLQQWPQLVFGPGDIAYLSAAEFDQDGVPTEQIIAISTTGPTAGQIVSQSSLSPGSALSEADALRWALGRTGVVDGWSGELLMPYVDSNGDPLVVEGQTEVTMDDAGVVSNGVTEWPLRIDRHPTWVERYSGGVPPRATPTGGAVYATSIGAAVDDADYPETLLPVVAFMHANGSVSWFGSPDGWLLSDSNQWGTLFISLDDSGGRRLVWLAVEAG